MIVLGAATGGEQARGRADAERDGLRHALGQGQRRAPTGGTIAVTGENISLTGAKLDASGQAGGGTVLIGGPKGNATLASSTVSIDSRSTIDVSAIVNGNAGKVVVWSDQLTSFAGLIKATGGTLGGDGGSVEVSSQGVLSFTGLVNVSAPAGKAGTVLLDPTDLWITTDGTVPSSDPGASAASGGDRGERACQPGILSSPPRAPPASSRATSRYRRR